MDDSTSVDLERAIDARSHGLVARALGLQAFWVLAAALLAAVVLSFATDTFATPQNLFNVTRNFAFVAIVAIGMTAVIITGGIDLSVGSILCLSAMVTGVVLHDGHSVWVGIAAGLAASLAVGLVNGVLIAYVRHPAVRRHPGDAVGRPQPGHGGLAEQDGLPVRPRPRSLPVAGRRLDAGHSESGGGAGRLLSGRRICAALDALGRADHGRGRQRAGGDPDRPAGQADQDRHLHAVRVHGGPGRRPGGELARRRDDQSGPVDGAQRDRGRGHRRGQSDGRQRARSWARWSAPR